MHHPTDRIAHSTAFVTPVVEPWLEREIAQWVNHVLIQGSHLSGILYIYICIVLSLYVYHTCRLRSPRT